MFAFRVRLLLLVFAFVFASFVVCLPLFPLVVACVCLRLLFFLLVIAFFFASFLFVLAFARPTEVFAEVILNQCED